MTIAKAQANLNKRFKRRAKMVEKSKPYFGAVTKLSRAYFDIKNWDVAPGVRRKNIKHRDRTGKAECFKAVNVRNGV